MRWRLLFRDWMIRPLWILVVLLCLVFVVHYSGLMQSLQTWLSEVVAAATGVIDPNGDNGTNTGTRVTCGGTLYFDCLNDAVRNPTTPTTGSDYVEYAGGNQTNSDMTTLTGVATVTAVAVQVFHQETGTNMTLSASLVNSVGTVIAGPTNFTNRATNQWDTINFTGLSLSQATLDGLRVRLTCTRSGGATGNRCRAYAMYADVTYDPVINVTVSATSTQRNLAAGTTTAHVGGTFAIVGNVGSRDITSITIGEVGTVDASANLKNIRLRYDLDTSAPYNCASESYIGTETQFGSTDADGFSGANGSSTFTGTVGISTTTTMCVYVVMDVQSTANAGETIEIEIGNPSVDVAGTGGPVISPSTVIALPGTTVIEKVQLDQVNYHWRNDDGSESGATSAVGGSENTPNTDFPKAVTQRLRIAVSNEGNATSGASQYRLEATQKVTTCAAATGWTNVADAGGNFDMSPTGNLTEGADTTNIATSTGGVSDPNPTFLTPNGGVRDVTSQTGNITLSSTQFVELEYAIIATSTLVDGTAYCFRVTNAGTPLDVYSRYPEMTIGADLTLAGIGTQVAQLVGGTVDQPTGGGFRLVNNTGVSRTLTQFVLTASGTSNVPADFSNIHLHYDLDTTAPYDCVSESFTGTEPLFSALQSGFNGSGQVTFASTTGVVVTNTQSLCMYVALDVSATVTDNTTVDFSVLNPPTNLSVGGASIAPNAQVNISGSTILARANLEQVNYHWRNNNGNETGATSATGGSENTKLNDMAKESIYRLRVAVSNEGLATSTGERYRLEYAQKLTTCSAATGWDRIDATGDAFEMASTTNLTDGANTTNIAEATGGVGNPNPDFLSANGGVKEDNDTNATTTLGPTQFTELEYSIRATASSTQGATYCFRVTDTGLPLDVYTRYPEAQIKLDTDFKIQRNETAIPAGATTVTITAGTDYEAPASSTRAFIRITNSQITGAGPNTTGNQTADNITAYIQNPSNIGTSITFARTGNTGDTRIYWEIIEYRGAVGGENEIVVRSAEALSYVSGNTTVTGAAISGVASSGKVAIFITGQHNRDASRNNYGAGLSTASFDGGTSQVTLTRGATGAISDVSYAAVEFTGANWKVQRSEHTYTADGATETETITAVNSLSRAFIHAQKRLSGTNVNHGDFGHEVWFSGLNQISFLLDIDAATAANHTSVAWVIENTQAVGARMVVTRSQSPTLTTSATANQSNFININRTLTDLSIASIFTNNRSDETTRTWPEPILGVTLLNSSTTQYLLWRGNASANVNFRTEVVEWPTAARKIEQNYYRLYVDNGALTPTDPWPVGGVNLAENAEMTASDGPIAPGQLIRLRMSLTVTSAVMPATLDSFRLQYAERTTTCSAATAWQDVGAIGSTTALWRGFNGTTTAGTVLSTDPPTPGDLLLSVSTVAGTYEEANDSGVNPYQAFPGDEIEYDWLVQHNLAKNKTSYCFRMIEASGTEFEAYNNYPTLRTVGYDPRISNWRFYNDETSLTPTVSLAAERVAPIDIVNQNIIKLRVALRESSGAAATSTKFALQYSQYGDFSREVYNVVSTTTCQANSLWCYADGAGTDNATITASVLTGVGTCSGGVGAGCGTYNEGTTTPSRVTHQALAVAEYEFTIRHAGARANGVYFFRLFDLVNNEVVPLFGTTTAPSLVTEGATLVSTIDSIPTGTTIAGVTTNVSSTPTGIDFGDMLFGTDYIAAHRLSINTNSTEGYQVLTFARSQLLNGYGDQIDPISATNAAPAGWSSACTGLSVSCVGYHTTDATLFGGSTRFAPNDSYAGLSTSPVEIMYSSVPANDVNDIIYRVRVSQLQEAGDYQTEMVYIAIPTH